MVNHVTQLPDDAAILDFEEALPSELKVVPLHIDGPRLIAHDVNTAFHASNEIGSCDVRCTRLKGHIGHALNRCVQRTVCVRTPIGAFESNASCRTPVNLIAGQNAIFDEDIVLRRIAFVIDVKRTAPRLDGAVVDDSDTGCGHAFADAAEQANATSNRAARRAADKPAKKAARKKAS